MAMLCIIRRHSPVADRHTMSAEKELKKQTNKPGHGKFLHYSASKDLLFFSEPELKTKSKLQICKSNPHSVKAT